MTGEIIAALKQESGDVNLGGQSIPMVQMVCSHCNHVMLFAAIPIFGKDL